MLSRLKEKGITIFVSTPYMDEATLCDRIGLIQEGKILSVNTPDKLIESYAFPLWAVRTRTMYQAMKDLQTFPAVEHCHAFGEFHHVRFLGEKPIETISNFLFSKGHQDIEVKAIKPTVEDCFLDLMVEKN